MRSERTPSLKTQQALFEVTSILRTTQPLLTSQRSTGREQSILLTCYKFSLPSVTPTIWPSYWEIYPSAPNTSHKICCALLGLAYTFPYHEPVYTGWSSVHLNATGMPRLTQCTLGYHWATQRILAGYTGTPLEKLSWNSPTLECHWRNLIATAPHWDATGETFAAYTGTPLDGLWQPTHAPTHIVKHAE